MIPKLFNIHVFVQSCECFPEAYVSVLLQLYVGDPDQKANIDGGVSDPHDSEPEQVQAIECCAGCTAWPPDPSCAALIPQPGRKLGQ